MQQPHFTTDKSLVVLPFKNLSGDSSYEYFSDGITEEIINALSKIEGLKVIARTSAFAFKGKPTDIRIIGNQLGVANAVEGSIRVFKQRIRINTQLTRTDNGFLLWSEKFDRDLDDVFALQDEISLLIADKIRENFGHLHIKESLATVHTSNLSAYQWYLKGRHDQLTWNLDKIERAISYYKKSNLADTSYADPVVSIGWCYTILAGWGHIDRVQGLEKAEHYVQFGRKMDPDAHLGHFAQATLSFWGYWQFDKGHAELVACLAENPYFSEGREALAELYTALGQFDKASEETERILKTNPLSPNHYYTAGNIQYLQGNYKDALQYFEQSLERDGNFDLSRHLKAACLMFLKEKQALWEFITPIFAPPLVDLIMAIYGILHEGKTMEINVDFRIKSENLMFAWDLCYQAHSDKEQALIALEKGVRQRLGQFINFQFDPFLKPLWHTPKFKQLKSAVFDGVQLLDQNTKADFATRASSFTPAEEALYLARLQSVLDHERAYLNADLSLRALAAQVDVHPNTLSRFINDRLQTNFNELINSKRLKHFQSMALEPKNRDFTLLGLAFDSGFNSKTAFNTYFKRATGTTPKSWLKNQG